MNTLKEINGEQYFDPSLREEFKLALPPETSNFGPPSVDPHRTYLPATHIRALQPDNMLVQGIRGAGKSYWCSFLQIPEQRLQLTDVKGLDGNTKISVGFEQGNNNHRFPSTEALDSLLTEGIDSYWIWRTVVFRHILENDAPAAFLAIEQDNWKARIQWLMRNTDSMYECWEKADRNLQAQKQFHIVLFDSLDRMADRWDKLYALLKGLFRVVLEMRTYQKIRVKIFALPNHLEENSHSWEFTDASKVKSMIVVLEWLRRDLYGLLWQHLANASEFGENFRKAATALDTSIHWRQDKGTWRVPETLRTDEDIQRKVFHAITGPFMGRGNKKGYPYGWLPNHLGDVRGDVSPRSFLAALLTASSGSHWKEGYPYLLHFEDIKTGVQTASRNRKHELEEDYRWISLLLEPLNEKRVPIAFDEIRRIWRQKNTLDEIRKIPSRLPPAKIDEGEDGVLQDLLELGIIEKMRDGRVNMPDIYRIAYGMGRLGGVKGIKVLSQTL